MEKRACIYCGTTEDLSDSDIIPDALTNAKIINPNVCRIAHNNKFSDMFEDEIIKGMALITNALNIKSSKGKKYATYEAQLIINGTEYSTKMSSNMDLFSGKKVISTEDGKTKLGSLEQIKKFKGANDENVTIIDINQIDIEKRITLNMEVFFSVAMHRLMAKIAYEWYCLHNNVVGRIDNFKDIIEFITTGSGVDPVELVGNQSIYAWFIHQSDFGNHTILSYIGLDNSVNCLVSFFGLAVYNIKLLSQPIEQCMNNAVYQQVTIDAKREQFCFRTVKELIDYFESAFYEAKLPNGMKCWLPKNKCDTSLLYQEKYIRCYKMFQNDLMCVAHPTEEIIQLLRRNLNSILRESALTLRSLKRFVKEHREYLNKEFKLNPKGTNKESIFLFYILFVIGESEGALHGMKDVNKLLVEEYGGRMIEISDELGDELLSKMLETEGYFEIIKAGAVAVEGWEYE